MARKRAVDIDAQQPLRFGAAERGLRILQIGDQRETAPVVGLAVEGRTDVTRRPLQSWTPSRASSCFTASVTVERGRPSSSAARVKLRRSTTRVNTRIASNRSMVCS